MITTTTTNIIYSGDGSTTEYSFNFPAIEPTDIHCYIYDNSNKKTDLLYGTDYTVTLNENGGYVYLTNPVASGNTLFINREVPYTQTTEYTQNSPFPAKSHEKALDKLTMEIQQVYEKVANIDSFLGEPATLTKYEFTASTGQTGFTISDGIGGVVFVYMNGVLLDTPTDYSISTNTIILTSGAKSGDILTVYIFSNFSLQGQTYTKADIDTMLASKADISLDNVNASDILTKLKTVDADDSGLNANFLQGMDSTKFIQVQKYNAILQNTDLNTIVQPQTVYCDTTNSNLPSVYNGTLLVTGNGTNKISQYFASEDGKLYFRYSTDGTTFSSWNNASSGGSGIEAFSDRTALRGAVGTADQIVLQKDINLFYRWVTPQRTDNDGTIINPTNDTSGSWVAIYGDFVYVEWFGAVGDGTVDDTDSIQNAINNADRILFKKKQYRVTKSITITDNKFISGIPASATGIGALGTVIVVDSSFSDSCVFNFTNGSSQIITGIECQNLYFECNKITAPIISIKAGYDQVRLRGISIINEYGKAIEIIPNNVGYGDISQTLYMENVIIVRGDTSNNKNDLACALVYANKLQEATFINCKFFAGTQNYTGSTPSSNSNGWCVQLDDCRGILFNMCSFANSNSSPVTINAVNRRAGFISFVGCTWENNVSHIVEAIGADSSTNFIEGIKVIAPRIEYPIANENGVYLKNAKYCYIEPLNESVTTIFDTGTSFSTIMISANEGWTNNGDASNTRITINDAFSNNAFHISNSFVSDGNITAAGSVSAANITATPSANKIPIADANGKLDNWVTASVSDTTFSGLTDTPSSYSGYANYFVRVKSDESGLLFDIINTPYGFHAYQTSAQSISGSTSTVLIFNVEEYDDLLMYNVSNGRFTAPYNGRYLVTAHVTLEGINSGKYGIIYIRKNGNINIREGMGISTGEITNLGLEVAGIIQLNAGDYLEILVYHTDSISLNTEADISRTTFEVTKIK